MTASDGFKELLCGSVAGMLGKIIEHPFDTIKVNQQTQPTINGPIDCLRKVWKAEGLFGLYRGLPSPLIGAMMENAVLFASYHRVQALFKTPGKENENLSISSLSSIGAISGFCAAFVLTPVELVKCKAQIQTTTTALDPYKVPSNTWTIFTDIVNSKGLRGLYKGFSLTALRESGGCGAWFGTYEAMCRLQMKDKERLDKTELNPFQLMFAGSTAGVLYNGIMFPVDVVKSIEQTSSGVQTKMMIVRRVWDRFGVGGFYRGVGVTLLRAIPANAIVFLTFETLKNRVV